MKIDQVRHLANLFEKDPIAFQQEYINSGGNFSNIYQELEMSSQYVDAHMDISLGDIPVNLHSHSFYEIVYVLSNSGTQYLAGTKRYLLQPGDIVLIPPGVGHKPIFPTKLAEPS